MRRSPVGQVAVVGVGNTDYAADYARARAAERRGEDTGPGRRLDESAYDLAVTAFKRALDDAGLDKSEIDGLAVADSNAYPLDFERVGEMLGLTLTWGAETGTPDHLIQAAVEGITFGRCDTVAIIYGNASRARGVSAYGGDKWPPAGYMNQWYYHVWGFSSPGAQFALAFQQYLDRFGKREEDLAEISIAVRANAGLNENAVMRSPLTLDDYVSSPYICRPFRRPDYCIVNDGGVCLILRRADKSRDLAKRPITISGIGRYGNYSRHTQMEFRLLDRTWENVERSSAQSLEMAGLRADEIDLVQCYDGFSFQIPTFLEGLGVCARGEGLDFIQYGRLRIDGGLPCNPSGGMLSESYMHGMNLHVETVRQLRGEAGSRQIPTAETAVYCHHGHWGALTMVYQQGD